jgi:hypothetical protein
MGRKPCANAQRLISGNVPASRFVRLMIDTHSIPFSITSQVNRMPIQVTCPGCLSRFTVSDKYAGKKGPCPKCKKELVVPDKSQEVVIHEPEPTGPKDSKGVAVLKPLKRIDFRLSAKEIAIASSVAIAAIAIALAGRFMFTEMPWWFLALGTIAAAWPLVWVGYTFLHDDELGGYAGRELLSRVAICSAIFVLTWGIYWFVSYYLGSKNLAEVDGIQFTVLIVIMFAIGTVASLATFELEVGQSILHYSLFFGVTFALAMIGGLQICEPLSNSKPKSPFDIPGIPNVPPTIAAPAADPPEQP